MTTIKTIIHTLATSAAESARRRALEALGVPVRVCDDCGRECWERRADGLCIRCVEGLRIDAVASWKSMRRLVDAQKEAIWEARGWAFTADRDVAAAKVASLECRRENGWVAAEAARKQRDEALADLATVIAERDSLRQHIVLTTRGDGLDDLRVRLANAAIAHGEAPWGDESCRRQSEVDELVAELDRAIRAKAEVTT